MTFEGRVLPFDSAAALAYAGLFAVRRRAGRPAATIDLMIAAIARSQSASLVTRNVADFAGCGISVIDPWGIDPSQPTGVAGRTAAAHASRVAAA